VVRVLACTLLLCALALASRAAIQGSYVEGISMLPTLQPGQVLLVRKMGYSPSRGDVIVFESPTSPGRELVKRVIGLPGDSVFIDAGHVSVNDEPLDEPYVQSPARYTYPTDGEPLMVPDDTYFVLGDNRPESIDSHMGWLVRGEDVVGQAIGLPWSHDSAARAPDPGTDQAESADGMDPTDAEVSLPTRRPALDLGPTAAQWAHGRLAAHATGRMVIREAPLPGPLRDVEVSATFRKVGGAPGGSTGLILRSDGAANYYTFELHDDGKVAIWRRAGDNRTVLLRATSSPEVRPGGSANELLARAAGDNLTLLVNGVQVASLTDAILSQGGAGVFVRGQNNEVEFQQFVVQPL
jgi:signal peptidase I